jgi:hypothetical protein
LREPDIDDERLAALLDGRVQGPEREALLRRIAASDDDFRDFAETAAVLRETEADEAVPRRAPGAQAAPPSTRAARGWRRPARWAALAVVLCLAASLALLARSWRGEPADPSRTAALLAAPGAPLPAGWLDERPWSGTLGGDALSPGARAARAGALHVDLAVAAAARDTGATARLAAELGALVSAVPGSAPVAEAYAEVGRLAGEPSGRLAPVLRRAGEGAGALLGREAVELGAWAEAARIAAARGERSFFAQRASRDALRRAAALPPPAGPQAERVRAALEGPDRGALGPELDRLLRALAG